MKYSLFRLRDGVEGIISYLICFTINSALTLVKNLNLESSTILTSFFNNIADYQLTIVFFFHLL